MNTPIMQALWLSIAIGWAIKLMLLRTGGKGVYRRARPFFLGLILGETLSAAAWTTFTLTMHATTNSPIIPQ